VDEIKKITKFLENKDFIIFALLFGSFSSGKYTDMSDIDLGIYLVKDISIIEYGDLVSQLESFTEKKIDLVILNNLYNENPRFAYQIITTGKILFVKDKNSFSDYKTKVFLCYFDTEPMLKLVDKAFLKRIKEGYIGERNYIGKIKNTRTKHLLSEGV
jgi:predicted nucleotidyltransferase